jgi:hypothetical protein
MPDETRNRSCVTCRHCRVPKEPYLDVRFSECLAPQNMRPIVESARDSGYLVDPNYVFKPSDPPAMEPVYKYCTTLRDPQPKLLWIKMGPAHCGPNGDWWEPITSEVHSYDR